MAIRKKLTHDMKTREKIRTSQIVNRLEKHILAKPEYDEETKEYVIKDLMSQSQVTAALGLIKKTLPDLSAVEHSGDIANSNAPELTDAELDSRIAESRERIALLSSRAEEKTTSKKVTH